MTLNEKTVVFHSMWEVRFVAACERFSIPWRSYDGPDIQTSEGVYRPDFIVNGDYVIDVKGWLRPESEQKVIEAREQGVDVHIVDKDDLEIMEAGADLAGLILNRA